MDTIKGMLVGYFYFTNKFQSHLQIIFWCFLGKAFTLDEFITLVSVEVRERHAIQFHVSITQQHELRWGAGNEVHIKPIVLRRVLHYKLLHLRQSIQRAASACLQSTNNRDLTIL